MCHMAFIFLQQFLRIDLDAFVKDVLTNMFFGVMLFLALSNISYMILAAIEAQKDKKRAAARMERLHQMVKIRYSEQIN